MARMSRLARMEIMRSGRNGNGGGQYGAQGMNDEYAESRFRDRSGREHYDNGRFAPMRNDTNIEIEGRFRDDRGGERFENRRGSEMNGGSDYGRSGYARGPGMPFPVYRGDRYGGAANMNQIGFDANREADFPVTSRYEVNTDYPMNTGWEIRNEMESRSGQRTSGHAMGADEDGYGASMPMTREKAEDWVHSMRSANGQQGQLYSMDQAKQIMQRHGLKCDPVEFYVALNMMKSDYGKVAKKMGVDKEEFYACMAEAFLNDEDAHKDKLARYYHYIVKKV